MNSQSARDNFVIPATTSRITKAGLPPSKSHLIRWLLLASQGENAVRIEGASGAAVDACAMRDALIELGVEIVEDDGAWVVHGVGANGFKCPSETLNLHNSATSLRLITLAVTRVGEWVALDGDATLESRIDRSFWKSLGIGISFDVDGRNLPMRVRGPIEEDSLTLNVSKTSQYLSALLLSMPASSNPLNLNIEGKLVSRRHAELSFSLANKCGSSNTIDNPVLRPWRCEPPTNVQIPPDASHVAFWKLYEVLHNSIIDWPGVDDVDAIGAEVLRGLDLMDEQTIDLSDANDLITPLAAALAIGGGGRIVGASHARYKESNRIEQTREMLSAFSLEVEATADGFRIDGGQNPKSPIECVPTFGDHRMQMTAVILATKVGAEIEGARLHEVSFPEFLEYIHP